eukprot:s308_g28.t1
MISAHRRVVAGMGAQVFQEQVLDKFGLVLDNEMVTSVATALGWNPQWLSTRQRPPVPVSHDITAMLNNAPTGVPVASRQPLIGVPGSSQSLISAPRVARGTIEIPGGDRVAVTDVTWLMNQNSSGGAVDGAVNGSVNGSSVNRAVNGSVNGASVDRAVTVPEIAVPDADEPESVGVTSAHDEVESAFL